MDSNAVTNFLPSAALSSVSSPGEADGGHFSAALDAAQSARGDQVQSGRREFGADPTSIDPYGAQGNSGGSSHALNDFSPSPAASALALQTAPRSDLGDARASSGGAGEASLSGDAHAPPEATSPAAQGEATQNDVTPDAQGASAAQGQQQTPGATQVGAANPAPTTERQAPPQGAGGPLQTSLKALPAPGESGAPTDADKALSDKSQSPGPVDQSQAGALPASAIAVALALAGQIATPTLAGGAPLGATPPAASGGANPLGANAPKGQSAAGQGALGQGPLGQGALGQKGAFGQTPLNQSPLSGGAPGQGASGQGASGQGPSGQGPSGQDLSGALSPQGVGTSNAQPGADQGGGQSGPALTATLAASDPGASLTALQAPTATALLASASSSPSSPNAQALGPAGANLAQQIIKRFAGGTTTFQVQLNPAELGRVDIHIEVTRDKVITATLSADNPQTLNELKNSSRELARTLSDAGLNVANNGLSFSDRRDAAPRSSESSAQRPAASLNDEIPAAAPRQSLSLQPWHGARVQVWA